MKTRKEGLVISTWVTTKKGNSFELPLPAMRIVCPTCNGKGSHVNPAIDGHGLDPQEFIDDPDFAEGYFEGRYDVTCYECKGSNVVLVPDEGKISQKMLERLYRARDQEAADRAEWEAERRMGA